MTTVEVKPSTFTYTYSTQRILWDRLIKNERLHVFMLTRGNKNVVEGRLLETVFTLRAVKSARPVRALQRSMVR